MSEDVTKKQDTNTRILNAAWDAYLKGDYAFADANNPRGLEPAFPKVRKQLLGR